MDIIKELAALCHDIFKGGSVKYAFTTMPTYPRCRDTAFVLIQECTYIMQARRGAHARLHGPMRSSVVAREPNEIRSCLSEDTWRALDRSASLTVQCKKRTSCHITKAHGQDQRLISLVPVSIGAAVPLFKRRPSCS